MSIIMLTSPRLARPWLRCRTRCSHRLQVIRGRDRIQVRPIQWFSHWNCRHRSSCGLPGSHLPTGRYPNHPIRSHRGTGPDDSRRASLCLVDLSLLRYRRYPRDGPLAVEPALCCHCQRQYCGRGYAPYRRRGNEAIDSACSSPMVLESFWHAPRRALVSQDFSHALQGKPEVHFSSDFSAAECAWSCW